MLEDSSLSPGISLSLASKRAMVVFRSWVWSRRQKHSQRGSPLTMMTVRLVVRNEIVDLIAASVSLHSCLLLLRRTYLHLTNIGDHFIHYYREAQIAISTECCVSRKAKECIMTSKNGEWSVSKGRAARLFKRLGSCKLRWLGIGFHEQTSHLTQLH